MIKFFEDFKLNEGYFDDIISGAKISWKKNVTGTYEEPIYIWITRFKSKDCFIENKNLDFGQVNVKLMNILEDRFDVDYLGSTSKFDYSKIEEVSEFLVGLGLKKTEFKKPSQKIILFNGKLTMSNLKDK